MSNLAVSTPSILVPRLAGYRSGPYFVVGFAAEICREFDQYVNLRPVRLFPGVPARWRENSLATSIFTWSGKTPRRIFLARR